MKLELDSIVARHPAARDGASPALKGLSLSVGRGEQVAIIGPSGAGKTTLLQILACALRPVSGRFDADGASPWGLQRNALQRLRGRLLLAPQVPPLPPRQRVITAVLAARLPAMGLWASVRSLFYPADIPAAFDALEQFDLGDKLFERVDRLSGGERQRVGLARALIAPAELWLIDEPLSALDPTRARQAMESLTAAARARSVTLISTLHQVDAALAHFPRIIGLRDGQIAFDLPSSEVSQALLERLYEQHEDELHGKGAPTIEHALPSSPQPAVMHCR